jgi:hypothetical protein
MFGTSRGSQGPATTVLLAFAFALVVAATIAVFPVMRMDRLEAEPNSVLPQPKNFNTSRLDTRVGADEVPFRHELNASVPAGLNSVLAFYRAELGKRGWTEASEHAVIEPDQALLAFTSPDGPAVLKLGRSDGQTTINLVQKIPLAAANAGVMPEPGQANLSFINADQSDATLTINERTFRIAAGQGVLPDAAPTLGLPPGKYRYSLQVANGPVQNNEIELTADEARGLTIGASGEVTLEQVY